MIESLQIVNRKKIGLSLLAALFVAMVTGFFLGTMLLAAEKIASNQYLVAIALSAFVFLMVFGPFFSRKWLKRQKLLTQALPESWRKIFQEKVPYFNGLNHEEQEIFLRRIQFFLAEKSIIPIETEIDEECRLLVAASAVIPVFALGGWEYHRLSTILIYPGNFDSDFQFDSHSNNILGMVFDRGSTMILSKPALYTGYLISKDKLNVGFHEFVHKIDGEDGAIDGLPALLANRDTLKEFARIRDRELAEIEKGKSDINPYGATNNAEFFAVVSEYFFENPRVMKEKHPELFGVLGKIYHQDPTSRIKQHISQMLFPKGKGLSKNAPCPCGSGLKYKHCHFKLIKKAREKHGR